MARAVATTLRVATVVLLVACSSGNGSSTGSTSPAGSPTSTVAATTTEPEPTTAWEQVLASLTDTPSVQTAVDAFSTAFHPIDGATPTDLPSGYSGSGSGPLRWLLAHRDELGAAQRQALDDTIAAWDDVEGTDIGGGGFTRRPTAEAPVALVQDMVVNIETLLGRELGVPITVKAGTSAADADNAMALTVGRDSTGGFSGPMVSCTIIFAPEGLAQTGSALVALAAHEVFHCFEGTLGTLAQSIKRPPWIVEGMAEWVGESISGGSQLSKNTWGMWMTHAWRLLFSRAYDAIGFYAHVNDNGVDVWSTLDAAITASNAGSAAAYQALIGTGPPDLVNSWAAGYFRDAGDSPLWDQAGPGITAEKPKVDSELVINNSSTTLDAPPYSVYFIDVNVQAEVVTLESPGAGLARLTDGTTTALTELHGTAFCTTESCVCPEGSPLAGTDFTEMAPGVVRLAPTGDVSGSHVVAIGWTLDRYCKGERCEVGTWMSSIWHAPRVIAGGRGAALVITKEGEGYIDWSTADDLIGVVPAGTTAGPDLLPLKVDISGASHFFLEPAGGSARVVSAAGSFAMTTYIDFGQGWFETGPGADSMQFAAVNTSAKFTCGGNTLLLNTSIEFRRVSNEAVIPPEASELTPTTDAGGGNGGGTGSVGEMPSLDPCALIPFAEIKARFPAATEPTAAEATGSNVIQCTYPGALVVEVFAPMPQDTFTGDLTSVGITVAPIAGIGEWAVGEVTAANPQFNLEPSVLLVAAGTSLATIAIVPFVDVAPNSTQYTALTELLGIAMGAI